MLLMYLKISCCEPFQFSEYYIISEQFREGHSVLITPHAQRNWGKEIGVSVHMFICLWSKKNLNRTLAIDSPFQTYAVGLLVEFID